MLLNINHIILMTILLNYISSSKQEPITKICDLSQQAQFSTSIFYLERPNKFVIMVYTVYQCYEKCYMTLGCNNFLLSPREDNGKKRECTVFIGTERKIWNTRFCCRSCICGTMKPSSFSC